MADGLFSGLESFGFSGLGNISLFGDNSEKEEKKNEKPEGPKKPEVNEKDFLFDKTTECPCCESKFRVRTVKSSAARLVGTDMDLRPRHENIDINKYDAIICPMCGYAALTRYFPNVLSTQKKLIESNISANFQVRPGGPDVYSYDDAIDIYKMALLNAVVKNAKNSEKAYICLKTSWMYRGKAEMLSEGSAEYIKAKENEAEFTQNAYEGFTAAVASENFPICGMDEMTVDYLLAALAFMTDHCDVSAKLISKILVSQSASSRIKDRTRSLKEEVVKKLRTNNG